MNNAILAAIDAEIAKLQRARALLANTTDALPAKAGRGRPNGSKNTPKVEAPKPKRTMSEAGKLAIAEAQRKRHAAKKKAAKRAAKAVAQEAEQPETETASESHSPFT